VEPDYQGTKALILRRLRKAVRQLAAPATPAAKPVHTLQAELQAVGSTLPGWVSGRRSRPSTYFSTSAATRDVLRAHDEVRCTALRDTAERIRAHEFDLLGSGPFVPVDATRVTGEALEFVPIDWHLDPVARCRFSRELRQEEWTPAARPEGSDIKRPWELGRCQHFLPLVQAYHVTGQPEYARELAHQIADFIEANPLGRGVNWACTMDVAIRAANWTMTLDGLRECSLLPDDWWQSAYAALFDHGAFIETHLENTYEVTSNHFLSDIVGLMFVAAAFRDLPQGQRWLADCQRWLEREMQVQVLPDGADYESSIPYHRLVSELFLGATRLGQLGGVSFAEPYLLSLRNMVGFLADTLRPDGLMAQVGDADDGRLHILTDYGHSAQDARHLFGAAAAVFADRSLIALGGSAARWEAAWWGLHESGTINEERPAVRRLFADAGIAVCRDRNVYLLITNGRVGTAGFGNHKHNDQLGFELHVAGEPLFVDPGSFVYTSDPAARNLFRSTAMHNTVRIDEAEQNAFNPEWLFRMFAGDPPEHLAFVADDDHVEYRGRHRGYARLPEPVIHQRRVRWEATSRVLYVADSFDGQGTHRLSWHFHGAPGVVCEVEGTRVLLRTSSLVAVLEAPAGLKPVVTESWYSPSYGRRERCQAVDFTTTLAAPTPTLTFTVRQVTP
jgi:hypothetical protein